MDRLRDSGRFSLISLDDDEQLVLMVVTMYYILHNFCLSEGGTETICSREEQHMLPLPPQNTLKKHKKAPIKITEMLCRFSDNLVLEYNSWCHKDNTLGGKQGFIFENLF